MANNYLDKNGLLYLWQKIKDKFVAKESGKGLSTNDFTTTLKNKLNGIQEGANKYTLPIASAETLGGVKVGAGLEINPSTGTLSATGGGTADAVSWNNVTDKPETYPPATHNHDSEYLKLSGGQMTGPIQFAPGQAQIESTGETAEAKVELDEEAAEIIYTDKTSGKTTRMTVSADGAEIVVGEDDTNNEEGMIKIFDSGIIHFYVGNGNVLEIGPNGLNVLDRIISHVATPTNNDDAANKGYVDTALVSKANSSDVYAKTETYNKEEINSKLSSIYKPGGSVLFSELPEPSASNLGMVYNLKEAFITDDRFLASTPVPYPIGTDVVVVAVAGDPTTYKFDVLAGFVDLSGYMQKTDMVAITNEEIDQIVGDSAA